MFGETEIKIRINSDEQFASILSRCQALYPGKETVINQRDEYYDTADQQLKKGDFTLRIRSVENQIKVAMKGPRIYLPNNIYTRVDLEFSAANESEVYDQIRKLELSATAIIEKRRWKFKSEEAKITLDKLPFIGMFIEIEAASARRINRILTLLQLSSEDAVRENYTELIEAILTNIGLPLRPNLRATFEAETEWNNKFNLPK
jgi:predicted adenylyl cyclase CyaB